MEKYYQMNGYKLYIIPSKKFKNITISLKLQNELTKDTVTKRTFLSFMLVTGTEKYPSTQLFSQYLENLYGMGYGTNVGTKGASHIININSVCINEEYLPYKEDLLTKQIEILNDVFHHPFVKNGQFDQKMFDIKKREVKDRLIANKDDKFAYGLEKLFEYMGRDQYLGISTTGYLEELDQITNEELYAYFLKCIQEDEKSVYIVGDVDESIIDVFKEKLAFEKTNIHFSSAYQFQSSRKDILEIIEKQDITQAKLNMGYTVDSYFNSENHYACTVFNALFGGFSQSKLFKVVREKHSLCYYVSSSYDAFNGIVVVNAGIEGQDYQKTRELIQQQLKCIQNGEISDEELQITKMMLKNAYTKVKDEPISMISLLFNRHMTDKTESDEDYLNKILNVTKEEVIAVSQTMKLDTIFLLTGRDA